MPEEAAVTSGVSVREAAKRFAVDPATVRRWLASGCPSIRSGRKGPGRGAVLDVAAVAAWRGRASGPAGLAVEEVLERIAAALWETVETDHVDIRAGVDRESAAAACLVVWERCCKNFGLSFKFDEEPESIRALMREL
jgi:hypothetical protein